LVVFDETGLPVANAVIEFLGTDGFCFQHTAYTGPDGRYEASLPPGTYYVSCLVTRADSLFIYQEFYDDVHNLADATPVEVVANDTTAGIDFGIPGQGGVGQFSISGTVTSDGIALENARVIFESRWMPWANIEPMVFEVTTDQNGYYELTVNFFVPVPFLEFIASARKPGFHPEFWEEKPSHFLADPIVLTSDTVLTDINFTLDPIISDNSISGTITGEDGTLIGNAFVIGSNAHTGELVFTFSDFQGNYSLNSLQRGNYYLLFAANGYVPEFYDDVLLWEQATPVFAAGAVTGIDAALTPISTDSSAGSLAGLVRDDQGNPLSGVLLALRNPMGDIISYAFSDGNGSYMLNGLDQGAYQVHASKVRYGSVTREIDFDVEAAGSAILDFTLNATTTGLPDETDTRGIPTTTQLYGNFPNPFNPQTTIRFGLPQSGRVKIEIYNLAGQKVRTLLDAETPAGNHSVTFEAGNLASGVYLYRLETEQFSSVKKMVLLK